MTVMRNPLSAPMEDALLSMPPFEGEMLPVLAQHSNAGTRLALERRDLVDFDHRRELPRAMDVLYARRTLKGEQVADEIRAHRSRQVAA